ncbi:MAG: transposase [Patescibacteria group bacterium]
MAQGEGVLVTAAMLSPAKALTRLATSFQQQGQHIGNQMTYVAHLATDSPNVGTLQEPMDAVIHQFKQLTAACYQQAQGLVDPDQLSYLTSIPGIGLILGTRILAELGDITRFHSPKQVVAYAGLDPRVKQSGTTLNRNTKLTKRGSPDLRRALFLASNLARRWNPDLMAYYQKKRAEGRSFTVANIATSRKLIDRIFVILTEQRMYQKRA